MSRRTNATNTGKQLEKILEHVHKTYELQGKATIEKVDPPVKMVGRGRAIMQSNPYLDYIGTTEGGIMLQVEAKSTDGGTLPAGGKSGLTAKQIAALRRWNAAGAITGCLWYSFQYQELRLLTLPDIDLTLEHRKSLTWETAHAIPDHQTFDYLPKLLELHRTTKRNEFGT